MNDTDYPETDSLESIYAERVRPLRTRSCMLDIPERENDAVILHTLLGIELQVGKRRFSCPDLATARYMRIFARIGCRGFAIPYDITKISSIADDLETAWQRSILLLETEAADMPANQHRRRRSQFVKAIRSSIKEAGAGEKMPDFKQSTKQSLS